MKDVQKFYLILTVITILIFIGAVLLKLSVWVAIVDVALYLIILLYTIFKK